MSRLSELASSLKSSLQKIGEQIRESESYQQIKAKYDELDAQTKLYVNLAVVAGCALVVFSTVLAGMAKVSSLKSDVNDREELIGSLERSADTIRQLKAQQSSSRGSADANSPLASFVENVGINSNLDRGKMDIGAERDAPNDPANKDAIESLVDVKISQINVRQLTRFLFNLVDQGAVRSLNIKDLSVDTKDASGYIDASVTVAAYRAK
jgi:hypothetical protein